MREMLLMISNLMGSSLFILVVKIRFKLAGMSIILEVAIGCHLMDMTYL